MRVIGLDPGSRVTGFGVIESDGAAFRHIESGNVRLPDTDLADRLRIIFEQLSGIIRTNPAAGNGHRESVYGPQRTISPHPGPGPGRGPGGRGSNSGVEVVEYSALQVKQATVGRGKAAKQQVQHMVRVLLGLQKRPPADTADALACAICHINTAQGMARINSGINMGRWRV